MRGTCIDLSLDNSYGVVILTMKLIVAIIVAIDDDDEEDDDGDDGDDHDGDIRDRSSQLQNQGR